MPSNARVFLKPFIGGLNTEGSDTDDLVLNTSDELNCTILPEGMRGRRYGFNIEKDGQWIDTVSFTETGHVSGSLYFWKNVAKTDLDILVCRVGSRLYFHDASDKPITQSKAIGYIDLDKYIIDSAQFYNSKFGFAEGGGDLIVVNRWMRPVQITYDLEGKDFFDAEFTLYIRDIDGVEDNWGNKNVLELVDEGFEELKQDSTIASYNVNKTKYPDGYIWPYNGKMYFWVRRIRASSRKIYATPENEIVKSTDNSLIWRGTVIGKYVPATVVVQGGSPEHAYNLLNQGWTATDLTAYKKAMVDANKGWYWPDNTMAPYIGREFTGDYNTGEVVYTYLGNTPQPRGHFILDFFRMNRSEVSNIWADTVPYTGGYHYKKTWHGDHNYRGIMIENHSTVVENINGAVNNVSIRWTLLHRKAHKDSGDNHWAGNIKILIYGWDTSNWVRIAERYTTATDGADADRPLDYDIRISDASDKYTKIKIYVEYSNGNGHGSGKHYFPQPLGVTVTYKVYANGGTDAFSPMQDPSKITDVAYMSGKYFYLCRDTVLFSQTITEDGKGFEKCYQKADPTNREVSDVVTTDGGHIKFNTIGRGLALETFNRGVLVFGRDAVFGLISPMEGRFTATDYDILELSKAGLSSAESVVSTTDRVFYWSPTGIYVIGVNPQTGTTIFSQSITLNTIQEYYNNIPYFSKAYSKGVYDYTNNRIHWYFPTDSNNINNLDGCLIYDLTLNCFMPQKISESFKNEEDTTVDRWNLDATGTTRAYEIEPTVYVRAGGLVVTAGGDKVIALEESDTKYHKWTSIQHLIVRKEDDNTYDYSIGDFNNREFRDWDKKEYDSYLVSRPITLGDTYYNKQTPVMQTLFKRTEGLKLRAKNKDLEYVTLPVISRNGKRYSTMLLNKSIINSAEAIIDLTIFPKDAVFNLARFTVRGHKNGESAGTSTHLGNVDLWNFTRQEIDGDYLQKVGDRITLKYEVPSEYSNVEFDYFTFDVDLNINQPYASEEYDEVDIKTTVLFKRTEKDGRKHVGWEKRSIVTAASMTKKSALYNTYTGILELDYCVIRRAKITPTPIFTGFSIVGGINPTYSGNLVFAGFTGLGDGYFDQNSTTLESNYVYYDSFNMSKEFRIDNFTYYPGSKTFNGLHTTFNLEVFVPQYVEDGTESHEYTTPSGAKIRMRWGWSVNPLSNRWDMVQNGYRPQKDFLHDDYVESRLHIHGRGKAFQVEIRNDEDKDFRLTGLNIITRSPQ